MEVQLPPAGGRERQPIGLGKELERLVGLEEVGDAQDVDRVAGVSRAQEPGEVDPTQDRAALGRKERVTPTPNGKTGRPPWA